MVVLGGGGLFLMSEVTLYTTSPLQGQACPAACVDAPRYHLTDSFNKLVLPKAIPAQIRQFIIYYY